MSAPRAFAVSREGDAAGFLGEGRGPFIFASDASVGFPVLEHARFTCVDAAFEDEVGSALESAPTFEAVEAALRRAGFRLVPVPYTDVFQPAEEVPSAAPPALEDLRALLSELE